MKQQLLLVLLLVVLGSLLAAVLDSEAVLVNSGSNVLSYFLSSCPSGWTSLTGSAAYQGRIIKGTTANIGVGTTLNTAITSATSPSVHSHTGWSVSFSTPSVTTGSSLCSSSANFGLLPSSSYTATSTSSTDSNDVEFELPYVLLNLCQFTGSESFTLPIGIVVYVSTATGSCPSGFAQFAEAEGRFLVFANAGVNLTTALFSPAAQVPSGGAVGSHTHTLPSFTFASINTCPSNVACTASSFVGAKGGATFTLTGSSPTGSASLPIPYVQLVACQVSDGTSNGIYPDYNAVFHYNGETCPPQFVESTSRTDAPNAGFPFSNLAGRLIVNAYTGATSGATFGGSQLTYAIGTNNGSTDAGHASHDHTYAMTSVTFSGSYVSGYVCGNAGVFTSCTSCPPSQFCYCDATPYASFTGYSFSGKSTSKSTASLIPYRVLRACSALASASIPTNVPSKSPSLSPSTSSPSLNPTTKPSLSPSGTLPLSPTDIPTGAPLIPLSPTIPTTSTPNTVTPVTSKPSTSTPTLNRPSNSPTGLAGSASDNIAYIVGGVVGGFATIMAGAFIVYRRRVRNKADDELINAWAEKLVNIAKENEMPIAAASGMGMDLNEAPAQFQALPPDLAGQMKTQVSFSNAPSTAYVESEEEKRQRRIRQLTSFYEYWDPENEDISGRAERLFNQYAFTYIARAVQIKYGILPPGWEEEFAAEQ